MPASSSRAGLSTAADRLRGVLAQVYRTQQPDRQRDQRRARRRSRTSPRPGARFRTWADCRSGRRTVPHRNSSRLDSGRPEEAIVSTPSTRMIPAVVSTVTASAQEEKHGDRVLLVTRRTRRGRPTGQRRSGMVYLARIEGDSGHESDSRGRQFVAGGRCHHQVASALALAADVLGRRARRIPPFGASVPTFSR